MRITAKSNYSTRTFTIRVYRSERDVQKYRTLKLDPEEFHALHYNTQNDWKEFLKSKDYHKV